MKPYLVRLLAKQALRDRYEAILALKIPEAWIILIYGPPGSRCWPMFTCIADNER